MVKNLTLALVLLVGLAADAPGSAADDSSTARVAQAASAFLAALDDAARAKASFAFDSEERFNWHFVPKPRAGLPLKAMSARQRSAAMDLLRAGLSEKGYTKAEKVRQLEVVLAEIEQDPLRRDPDLYYVSIFGEPAADGTWGWRFEGHHISLNWTFVRGQSVAPTPQFFGSNPDAVPSRLAAAYPRACGRAGPGACAARKPLRSATCTSNRQRRGATGHLLGAPAEGRNAGRAWRPVP